MPIDPNNPLSMPAPYTHHVYAVGRPYSPQVRQWPGPDRHEYNYRAGDHELRLFLANPTPAEIRAVQEGKPIEFALYLRGPVIFFCVRFPPIPWAICPYSWFLVLEAERMIPDPADDTDDAHRLISTLLVDRNGGILKALRVCTMSPAFGKGLHAAIRTQIAAGWPGPTAYEAAVQAVFMRFPNNEDIVAQATLRCRGGD